LATASTKVSATELGTVHAVYLISNTIHNILASKSRSLIYWSGPPVLTNSAFRLNKVTLSAGILELTVAHRKHEGFGNVRQRAAAT
jgi:hypothetical protein